MPAVSVPNPAPRTTWYGRVRKPYPLPTILTQHTGSGRASWPTPTFQSSVAWWRGQPAQTRASWAGVGPNWASTQLSVPEAHRNRVHSLTLCAAGTLCAISWSRYRIKRGTYNQVGIRGVFAALLQNSSPKLKRDNMQNILSYGFDSHAFSVQPHLAGFPGSHWNDVQWRRPFVLCNVKDSKLASGIQAAIPYRAALRSIIQSPTLWVDVANCSDDTAHLRQSDCVWTV